MPDPSYGLPELASEERIRELNTKKRAKVMSPSVARKVQKVIEALDEASILEEEQRLLKKEKKEKEANAKDSEIKRAVAKGQQELDELKPRMASLKSYDRSMIYYYQSGINKSIFVLISCNCPVTKIEPSSTLIEIFWETEGFQL